MIKRIRRQKERSDPDVYTLSPSWLSHETSCGRKARCSDQLRSNRGQTLRYPHEIAARSSGQQAVVVSRNPLVWRPNGSHRFSERIAAVVEHQQQPGEEQARVRALLGRSRAHTVVQPDLLGGGAEQPQEEGRERGDEHGSGAGVRPPRRRGQASRRAPGLAGSRPPTPPGARYPGKLTWQFCGWNRLGDLDQTRPVGAGWTRLPSPSPNNSRTAKPSRNALDDFIARDRAFHTTSYRTPRRPRQDCAAAPSASRATLALCSKRPSQARPLWPARMCPA